MKESVSSSALIDNASGVCTNKVLLSYTTNDMSNHNESSSLAGNLKLDLNIEQEKSTGDSGFTSNSTSEIIVSPLINNYSIGNDTFFYSHNLTQAENRVI